MGIVRFWLTGVYIWIKVHHLSYKYNQSADNIYKAYVNFYCSFKTVESLLKRCKSEDKDFDCEFVSLMKAKDMMEEFVKNGKGD